MQGIKCWPAGPLARTAEHRLLSSGAGCGSMCTQALQAPTQPWGQQLSSTTVQTQTVLRTG